MESKSATKRKKGEMIDVSAAVINPLTKQKEENNIEMTETYNFTIPKRNKDVTVIKMEKVPTYIR